MLPELILPEGLCATVRCWPEKQLVGHVLRTKHGGKSGFADARRVPRKRAVLARRAFGWARIAHKSMEGKEVLMLPEGLCASVRCWPEKQLVGHA
jgi:hypothetical protein